MYRSIEDQSNAYDHINIGIEYLHFVFDLCMIF